MSLVVQSVIGFVTQGFEELASTSGTPTINTERFASGTASIELGSGDSFVVRPPVFSAVGMLQFKFYYEGNPASNEIVQCQDQSGGAENSIRHWAFWYEQGHGFSLRDAGNVSWISSSSTGPIFNPGEWNSVRVGYEVSGTAGRGRVWVNGREFSSALADRDTLGSASTLQFLFERTASNLYLIDNIAVYNDDFSTEGPEHYPVDPAVMLVHPSVGDTFITSNPVTDGEGDWDEVTQLPSVTAGAGDVWEINDVFKNYGSDCKILASPARHGMQDRGGGLVPGDNSRHSPTYVNNNSEIYSAKWGLVAKRTNGANRNMNVSVGTGPLESMLVSSGLTTSYAYYEGWEATADFPSLCANNVDNTTPTSRDPNRVAVLRVTGTGRDFHIGEIFCTFLYENGFRSWNSHPDKIRLWGAGPSESNGRPPHIQARRRMGIR